ncbi:MAG: DUF2958 domain-containing protein [Candidatus Absconditabacterales bacterium]
MKLMTKELQKRFEQIGSQKESLNPIVVCKCFCPRNSWTWYAIEFNKENSIFFGYVIGDYQEWGCFSLKELESVQGPYGLKIERDLRFSESLFLDLNVEYALN